MSRRARHTRRAFTEQETIEIWQRWKKGESLESIGRSLERFPDTIYYVLSKHGGVKLPVRTRASRALSLQEREEISRGLAEGRSLRSIAQQLHRAPSTISREVRRNGGSGAYRATQADNAAWVRAKRPKPCKLASNRLLKHTVETHLRQDWSPEQIAGWLKRQYPTEESNRVSHETIYKSLYIQTRGVLKKELLKSLRSQPRLRRTRSPQKSKRGLIPDLVSISERPAMVEDRALPGHWEGDLIEGSNRSYIATLVEHANTIPSNLYQSLTWDRGSELKQHKRFTLETDIQVYFCDPQSPWQRGSNENTNRLLRQYLPKGTDLSVHTQEELNAIARKLNERPRKTLEYLTPADKFMACVASTT